MKIIIVRKILVYYIKCKVIWSIDVANVRNRNKER